MRELPIFVVMVFIFMVNITPVQAERAWEGHIRIVDSNITMVFEGYDYGTWDDVGRLEFPSVGRPRDGVWSVRFGITPDDDNELLSTISGTIELVVDEQKKILEELRFIRKHKHANWRIDPKIIQQLKGNSAALSMSRETTKSVTEPVPERVHGSLSSIAPVHELLDVDFMHRPLAELSDCDLKGVSVNKSGLYLNGQYEFGNEGYRAVIPIMDLDYSQFSFCLDFQGLDFRPANQRSSTWVGQLLGSRDAAPHTNLITGGTSYRWFGLKVRDGHLWLTLNNGEVEYAYKNAVIEAKKWHSVAGSFDLDRGVIQLMLDGELIATEKLPKNFAFNVVGTSEEQNDRQLAFTDYSNSECFHGYIARLIVRDAALSRQDLADWHYSRVESLKGRSPSATSAISIPHVLAVFAAFCVLFVILRMKRLRNLTPNEPGMVNAR